MVFGFYMMIGWVVLFLGLWLFLVFVDVFYMVCVGFGGVCFVLIIGLLFMLWV